MTEQAQQTGSREVTVGQTHVPEARRVRVGRAVRVVAALVVLGALGALAWWGLRPPPIAPRTAAPWSRVAVGRTTLRQTSTLDGQVGYGTAVPLVVRATGTITWLPSPGAVIRPGGVLLRVDERPVVLMAGSVPQYRSLGPASTVVSTASPTVAAGGGSGASSKGSTSGDASSAGPAASTPVVPETGRDVRQLEQNLARLGFGGFTVDDVFTNLTARAVTAWQQSLGVAGSGTVEFGDVVFIPDDVRIATITSRVGDPVGSEVLNVTGLTRQVTATGNPSDLGWAQPGTPVEVLLSSGAAVSGRVENGPSTEGSASDGPNPASGPGAGATITVSVADQAALAKERDATSVTVVWVGTVRADVLAVPPAALIALAEGGYGVEVIDSASLKRSHVIAVTTGLFADGLVEVSGSGLNAGDLVRLPE